MNIYRNFLPKKDIHLINTTLTSGSFPWYYEPRQIKNSIKDTSFLSHTFFINGKENSSGFFLMKPILK